MDRNKVDTQHFPDNLRDLQKELLEHAKDGRSDLLFRGWIFADNYGAFCRHISHDRTMNPTTRPHGTEDSKIADAGHFLVQALTLVALSDVDIEDAICTALVSLRSHDCLTRTAADPDKIKGQSACTATGHIKADAWVVEEGEPMLWPRGEWQPLILVASHPQADKRLAQFAGIVTDQGGECCHSAIIAREHGIPCIVGTGNATKKIQTGDLIEMNTITGEVTILKG